jgi:hypothetical protein
MKKLLVTLGWIAKLAIFVLVLGVRAQEQPVGQR